MTRPGRKKRMTESRRKVYYESRGLTGAPGVLINTRTVFGKGANGGYLNFTEIIAGYIIISLVFDLLACKV